jgi:hypothetical protein
MNQNQFKTPNTELPLSSANLQNKEVFNALALV